MLFFGIDWSEDHHNLCILNEAGARISEIEFKHSVAGFAQIEAERQVESAKVAVEAAQIAYDRAVQLLKNKAGDLGSSLRFSLAQMPCFSLWKNTAARDDGYVTGLEPGEHTLRIVVRDDADERSNGRTVQIQAAVVYGKEIQ